MPDDPRSQLSNPVTLPFSDASAAADRDAATLPPAELSPVPLDQTAAGSLGISPGAASAQPLIPGYEILAELGRGGMGIVYKARHVKLNRTVALKMILAGAHAGTTEVQRFRAEAEAVARLQHPNVVQVYEIGDHNGLPFFALEFCSGGSLAETLAGTPLPAREAARLVETLARAVHAAHEQNIIHRDLKPANILLASAGASADADRSRSSSLADCQPKITDFGLAKQLDNAGGQTQSGAILGTPSYMAPEQAGGKGKEVGPAADVYALGAILYECLTGRPPFRAATPLDTVLQVVAEEPVPPRRLQPRTPRDLETVCLKCLQKDPRKRYASAAALAEDLQRFLEGESIRARPAGLVERAVKWTRRRPAAAALIALGVLAASVLLAGSLWYNARLGEERDVARRAQVDAERQRDEARHAQRVADEQRLSARRHLHASQINLAYQTWEAGQVGRALEVLQSLRPAHANEEDLRGLEWNYLSRLCHDDLLTFRGHASALLHVDFSPDGKWVASCDSAARNPQRKVIQIGTVKVWDPRTGRVRCTFKDHHGDVYGVAFSPDGQRLASGGSDGLVRIADAATGQQLAILSGHKHLIFGVTFSPDGKRLASACADATIRIWNVKSGKTIHVLSGHKQSVRRLAYSPDGKRLASAGLDGLVKVWDPATGKLTATLAGHRSPVLAVAFSPDGKQLASGGFDRVIRLWDLATGREVRALPGHTGWIAAVAFSHDGRRLASAGGDKVVRLWDAASGREMQALRGLYQGVNCVAFSPDDRLLAGAGSEGTAMVWDLRQRPNEPRVLAGFRRMAFSPDGRLFAAAGVDNTIKVWSGQAEKELFTLRGHTAEINQLAFSPDSKILASACDDRTIRLWDTATGKPLRTLTGHKKEVWSVAYTSGGKVLVSGGEEGHVFIWDPTKVAPPRILPRYHQTGIASLDADRTGRLIATAGQDGTMVLWDMAAGGKTRPLAGHTSLVFAVAFSPDGRRLASASLDGTVKVWDVATGGELLNLKGQRGMFGGVAFSPDGRRLAAGSAHINSGEEAELILWDATSGQELLHLPGRSPLLTQVAFSPDGQRLAAAGVNLVAAGKPSQVVLWDATIPPYPDTAGWKVLFADDFKRNEIGPRWTPSGRWQIVDGSLRGELQPVNYHFIKVNSASIRARGLELPDTVEVRFDCWTSADMNCHAMFTGDPSGQSLMAWLLGVSQHFGTRGASLVWQGGAMNFPPLTFNPRIEFRPGARYRVRVLREPGRLAMFVDGMEVVSAQVPPLDAPTLALGGMMARPGTFVHFANVEVRAPAEAVRAREVRTLAKQVCNEVLLRDEAIARLGRDPRLTPAERKLAIGVAEDYQEEGGKIGKTCWAVVRLAGGSESAYRLALRKAEAIRRLTPKGVNEDIVLTLLGIAQFRAGRLEEAVKSLARAERIIRAERGGVVPEVLAVQTMAHHRLGQKEAAQAHLRRLRDARRSETWGQSEEARALLDEAEALVGPSLPAPAADEREQDVVLSAYLKAEEAGWQHGDLNTYLALWADDARDVAGRAEKAGPHDVVLDRRQVEALRRLQFRARPPAGTILCYENVHCQVQQAQAILRMRTTISWKGSRPEETGFLTLETLARLRRNPKGWKLYDRRGWPVERRNGGRKVVYTAAAYREMDSRVELLRKEGKARELAVALEEAYRFAEGLAEARKLTGQEGAQAADWFLRGRLAVAAGDARDAEAALRRAQVLDPKVLPAYWQALAGK